MSQANESAIEQLNIERANRVEGLAAEARRETIDIAYEAVALYLADDTETLEDLHTRGFPKGETTGFYVTEDLLVSPSHEQLRSFGILLVDASLHEAVGEALDQGEEVTDILDDEMDDVGEDNENRISRLKVSIPVPDDVYLEDREMPPRDTVDRVFLAYTVAGEDNADVYYEVSEQAMVEIDVESAEQSPSSLDYIEFLRHAKRTRVSEAGVFAMQAVRNIINMKAVPRRYITPGEPGVKDF